MLKEKEDIVVQAGDVVLFYQNNFPVDFLHVMDVKGDVKQGWWLVAFRKIGMPSLEFVWKLDDNHIRQEIFEMNGVPCHLQIYSRAAGVIFHESKRQDKKEAVNSNISESKGFFD